MNKRFSCPPLALDFDGVLHEDTGPWRGPEKIEGKPVEEALAAVQEYAKAGLKPVVYSCRALVPEGKEAIEKWLVLYGFPPMEVFSSKPWACLYIDDRGYQFDGVNWPTVRYVRTFLPWTKTEAEWAQRRGLRGMARGFGRIRELRECLLRGREFSKEEQTELGQLLDQFVLGNGQSG